MVRATRVTMLLENDLYPQDVRVRDEAHSLRDAGYSVHVIAPRGPGQPSRDVLEGVRVERFRTPRELGSGAAAILIEYLIAHAQLFARSVRALVGGADVVHLHNPPDTLFPIALLARVLGRRVVFDQHDLFPELFAEKFGRSRLVLIARGLQTLSARSAHLSLATNDSQRACLLECGIESSRVAVIRNGPPEWACDARTITRPGHLQHPRLLYVGALEPQDGVDLLPDVLSSVDGAYLTVVGWGSCLETVRAAIAARGLESRAHFTGRVSHLDVLALIAEADICLDVAPCTPLNNRTTMVKVAEYMALGKPTLSFALDETLYTGGDAVACAPCGDWPAYRQLLAELVRDGDRRIELGRRARERSRELTWGNSARALLAAYRRLVRPPCVSA